MRSAFALLTLCLLSGWSSAQYCRTVTVRSYAPSYVTPTYVAPTHYDYKHIVVPIYDHYYTVNVGDYGASLIADAAAFRALQLLKASPLPGPTPTPTPDARPAPGPTALRSPTPGNLKAVVEAKCIKCHGTDAKGIDLTNLDAVPRVGRLEAWRRITLKDHEDEMPPARSGVTLTDEDRVAFHNWILAAPKK